MNAQDQIAEIGAFYDKLRKKLGMEFNRNSELLNKAEAARKVFQKPASATNGAAPRTRKSRLDPDMQKAILAVLTTDVGYTAKEIAKFSKAGRSQVRTALQIAEKAGTIAGDLSKRNRRYVLTTAVTE